MMVPIYNHDCARCRLIDADYIGEWYFCPPTGAALGAIVCRFGSDPEDYWSTALDILKTADESIGTPRLRKARKLYVVLAAALEGRSQLLKAVTPLDYHRSYRDGSHSEYWTFNADERKALLDAIKGKV